MADSSHIVILGIGNLLWADEGFGVRAVEALHAGWQWPAEVELVDGGTQGLALLPIVQAASHLLILDAIDAGLAPGELAVFADDAVPAYLTAKKMSLHQTGFAEVLALAELSGQSPGRLVLVGVQPVELEDYGGSLTAPVRAQLPLALARALDILAGWGVYPAARQAPAADGLHDASLALLPYEAGRPSAEAACRVGDARVLAQGEG